MTTVLVFKDRLDADGEQRWHAIGLPRIKSNTPALLLAVHVYRENYDGEEIIRIISARSAEKDELRRHKEDALE